MNEIINFGEYNVKMQFHPYLPAQWKELSRSHDGGFIHCTYRIDLVPEELVKDISIEMRPDFQGAKHWTPHLTPSEGYVVDQHVFRTPAVIMSNESHTLALIPDLDLFRKEYKQLIVSSPKVPKNPHWYLDLDAPNNKMCIGISHTEVKPHTYFRKSRKDPISMKSLKIGFYLLDVTDVIGENIWRAVLDFFWNKWGEPDYQRLNIQSRTHHLLQNYADQAYSWAFINWKDHLWQEFTLNEKKVGGPALILNYSQSPNSPKPYSLREFHYIWNQAWFCALKDASGMLRYANRYENPEMRRKAMLVKELALQAPQDNGVFPTVIGVKVRFKLVKGKICLRPLSWDTHYWGNSNRNPFTLSAKKSPYHILDMSWTALWMLRWYEELEKDPRLLNYARKYADTLLTYQDSKGYFPGWLHRNGLKPTGILDQSPESSASVIFLLQLYGVTGDPKYLSPALKAMDIIMEDVLPNSRWEDFETYWSCSRKSWLSRKSNNSAIGKKVKRNNCYKQCNFSMYWTAEALLGCYRATEKNKYLSNGQRVLDEMLMYQASWQPPHISVNTLGTFGVMNADAEWNDARTSLFAELIIEYGNVLENQEYIQRGLAALKNCFEMMYSPLNPELMALWDEKYPFFNDKDYGFMMEGYGHNGNADNPIDGLGTFTIFDWGPGSASEAFFRILDHYGEDFINNQ